MENSRVNSFTSILQFSGILSEEPQNSILYSNYCRGQKGFYSDSISEVIFDAKHNSPRYSFAS